MRPTIRASLALLSCLAMIGTSGCRKDVSQSPAGGLAGKGDGPGGSGGGRSPDNASGGAVTQWTQAGPMWVADWTLLVYAANDDKNRSLVEAFDGDLEELRRGLGGSAAFRILVQRDYAGHQRDGDGQSRQTERYGLYREQRYNPETLKLEDPARGEDGTIYLGETDSANPQTLADFLVYGVRRFPAKRYWVIITGHGDGFNGVAFDATTGQGVRMPVSGLQQALAAGQAAVAQVKTEIEGAIAQKRVATVDGRSYVVDNAQWGYKTKNIDLIQFDACHMGNLEAAVAVAPYADYMVASQEVMPNSGHPYSALRNIAQNYVYSAAHTVVENVVTDYVRAYVDGVSTQSRSYVGKTVSSIGLDLTKLRASSPMVTKLADFVSAVQQHHHPGGFTCAEVVDLAQAAKERANLVGHVVEPPSNVGRCIGAKPLELSNGKVMIRGDLGEYVNEHAGLSCSGVALDGPQAYYKVYGHPDRSYQITINTDYEGGEAYIFTGGCTRNLIQADCQSNGARGVTSGPLTRRQPKAFSFSPASEGYFTIAIDGAAAPGRYILGVQETDALQENGGRATVATNASVDLVALFETIAGFERYKALPGHNCKDHVDYDPYPQPSFSLHGAIKDAAQEMLLLIDRPHLYNPRELEPRWDGSYTKCGKTLFFGEQYRKMTKFDGESPFVAEAHKVERSTDATKRAPGMSLLFGDVYPMTGNGELDAYRKLGLEAAVAATLGRQDGVGWLGAFSRCVDEVMACRQWDGQGQNPCLTLPF